MRRTIQGDLGSVTLVPQGEEEFTDEPRHFLDEFDAESYLRSQFLADPNDMTLLRALLDDAEGMMMMGLSDADVIARLANHIVSGSMTLLDDGTVGGFGGWGGTAAADNEQQQKKKEEAKEESPAQAPKPEKKKILIDVVIKLMYWNPVTGKPAAFPKGVKVDLVNNSSVIESRTTDESGICAYSEREYTSEKPYFIASFLFAEYIDLDKNELVSAGDVSPGDQRRLLRMPRTWDSTKEEKFVDKRGGRFSKGKLSSVSKGQQGTKGSPWKIQVDYGWEKLWAAFIFYNPLAKKTEGVCYGGLLEVFNDSGMGGNAQVAGGTVIDRNKGLCYIGVWRKTDRDKLHMRLRYGANAYLDLKKKAASRAVLTVAQATLLGYPGVKRRRHYPLPAEWCSKKQYARLGKKRWSYEKHIVKGISKGQPITFHLDDFVLVKANGVPEPSADIDQFTIFNNLMGILDPAPDAPYYSHHAVSDNHFYAETFAYVKGKGTTHATRVVGHKRGFYDLLHKRTTQGDIIGARAAVLDDHPSKLDQRRLTNLAGNYTVHYFHDCAIYKGKPLAHLLIYWSVLLQPNPDVNAATSDIDYDVEVKYQKGTKLVKERHEGLHPADPTRSRRKHKDYSLVPIRGPERIIKVCIHIERRQSGTVHTTLNLQNDGGRDGINLFSGTFSKSSAMPRNNRKAMDKADRLTFKQYVFAHETGHALGLHDEYIEVIRNPNPPPNTSGSLWTNPSLAQYTQRYAGMPYSCEEGISMMESNCALRLRHYWQYCRFVNEDAAVKRLLGNVPYRIEYPIQGGPTLRYRLKWDYRKIYEAYKDEAAFTQGQGKMGLFLYKIGQDETQLNNVKAGFTGMDSILVVRLNIHWSWPQNHRNRSKNNWALQTAVIQQFQKEVSKFVGENNAPLFTLECDTGDFRRCLVYFKPHYAVNAGAAPAGTQFKLQVRPHGTGAANNIQDVYKEGFTGDTIKVTDRVKWPVVLRYMLGMKPVNVTGTGDDKKVTPIATIKETDLDFLATWVKGKLAAGDFKVKKH